MCWQTKLKYAIMPNVALETSSLCVYFSCGIRTLISHVGFVLTTWHHLGVVFYCWLLSPLTQFSPPLSVYVDFAVPSLRDSEIY